MNTRSILIPAALVAAAAVAAPRSSQDYHITAEVVDFGGSPSASADYSALGSFNAPSGVSATPGVMPDYTAYHGFLSQLGDGRTLPSAFVAWQTVQFGDPGDPAAGPLSDDDKDGIDNIAEFSFGLDPHIAAAGTLSDGQRGLPVYQSEHLPAPDGPVYNTIEFIRRTNGAVNYRIATSSDMETWMPASVVQVGEPTPSGDGFEKVKFAEAPVAAVNRRYLRVLLTLQGP